MASDDMKVRLHNVMKDPDLLKEIRTIASRDHISFNQAMQKYYSKDDFKLTA